MQRTNFDVESIASLLRQTEVNISALKPQEDRRYHEAFMARRGHPAPSVPDHFARPAEGFQPQARSPSGYPPDALAPRHGSITGTLELEAQLSGLHQSVARMERRLEEELRAELQELSRATAGRNDRASEEIWEAVRRLSADSRSFEGRLQRCSLADEVTDRFREMTRTLHQKLDDKLAAFDRRAVEHRASVESSSEAWREAIQQRCHQLESRVWEQNAERTDLADKVLKQLPESSPFMELNEIEFQHLRC